MARSGIYKNGRTNRNYTMENTFSAGMSFLDTPLEEGACRLLVNMDLASNKTTLVPRAGLVKKDELTPVEIVDAKLRYYSEYNTDKLYRKYFLENSTGACEVRYAYIDNGQGVTFVDQITNNQRNSPLSDVHGIPYEGAQYFVRNPHCMAYNNTFYVPIKGGFNCYKNVEDPINNSPKEFLEARRLNASEAVAYGYNMLLEEPYEFSDSVGAEPIILGIAAYDENGKICLDPKVNQMITFRANISLPYGNYYYLWLSRTAENDNYTIVGAGYLDYNTNTRNVNHLEYKNNIPGKNYFLQLVLYKCVDFVYPDFPTSKDTSTVYHNLAVGTDNRKWYYSAISDNYEQASQFIIYNECPAIASLESSFAFTDNVDESKGSSEVINYDLQTCLGMTFWNKYLVMYAPKDGENVLFLSAYNEPEFFPYPNNADIFDEKIRYCVPYLSDLLVFTESQIWRLVLNTTSTGWTKSLLQGNLNIQDSEICFIQVVKNMVYFKSGDGYFMIVPKSSSTTGELTLAPVSKNIELFYKDFENNLKEVITRTYGLNSKHFNSPFKDATIKMIDAYNYLDYEDIHNVYRVNFIWDELHKEEFTIEVLYNTVARYWHIYCYQCNTSLQTYTEDATRSTGLMGVMDNKLYYIARENIKDNLLIETNYGNYQLIDSGYHDYVVELKKRFRELQFLINNLGTEDISFNLGYILDSTERVPLYEYQVTTKVENGLGIMYLTRVSEILPGQEVFHRIANRYVLRQEDYPDVHMWKIRTGISGKGYAPRFQLNCIEEKPFELLNFIWVYRTMNLR